MLVKVFWSLLALLTSLLGFWGAVELGWTFELLGAAMVVATCLVLALVTGKRRTSVVVEAIEDSEDESGADETRFVQIPTIPIRSDEVVAPGLAEETRQEEALADDEATVLELPVMEIRESLSDPEEEIPTSSTRRFEWGEISSIVQSADSGPSSF